MQKSIGISLYLVSLAAGVIMQFLPKTLPFVITSLLVIYGLLVYPIWNFWYIERSLLLRLAALFFLASCLCVFGYIVLSGEKNKSPNPTLPTAEEIAKEVWKKAPDNASEKPNTRKIVNVGAKKLPTHPQQTPSIPLAVKPPTSADEIFKITTVPDLKNTKKFIGLKISDFSIDEGNYLDTEGAPIDGYFNVNIKAQEGTYNVANVQYNKTFKPHFYISVRLAGDGNVRTLEIQGLGIYFLIENHGNKFYIWASEQNEQKWTPLPVPKDPVIDTLGIYQNGRYVVFFLNNRKVANFDILATPEAGKVGLAFKTRGKTGGKAHFQMFAVYVFPN